MNNLFIKKSMIGLALAATLATTAYAQQNDGDLSVLFKNGQKAVIYKQGDFVTFQLCPSDETPADRHCTEHAEAAVRNFTYIVRYAQYYVPQVTAKFGVTPPYNVVDGRMLVEKAANDTRNSLPNLDIDQRALAEEKLMALINQTKSWDQADRILLNLEGRPTDFATVTEEYTPELFEAAYAPFRDRFKIVLPGDNERFWLDTNSGFLWAKLGMRNWYDANNVPRERTTFDYPEEFSCGERFGEGWRLPLSSEITLAMSAGLNIFLGIKSTESARLWTSNTRLSTHPRLTLGGLGVTYDHPHVQGTDGAFATRNLKFLSVCMGQINQANPDEDFDNDGVSNANDYCHIAGTGAPVNTRGCERRQGMDHWRKKTYYLGATVGITADNRTVWVNKVDPGSPAEQAHLALNDRIESVNGVLPTSIADFNNMVASSNGTLDIRLRRNGRLFSAFVMLHY